MEAKRHLLDSVPLADQLTEVRIAEVNAAFSQFNNVDDGTVSAKYLAAVMRLLGQDLT